MLAAGLSAVLSPSVAGAADLTDASLRNEASEAASAADVIEKRVFIGRATLGFLQSVALPDFECPAGASWVQDSYRQNANMPRGVEAGSGNIHGHINSLSYKTYNRSVQGWKAYWANTITNWNFETQDVFIYVHCTSAKPKDFNTL
jgi:hypothetical protein